MWEFLVFLLGGWFGYYLLAGAAYWLYYCTCVDKVGLAKFLNLPLTPIQKILLGILAWIFWVFVLVAEILGEIKP